MEGEALIFGFTPIEAVVIAGVSLLAIGFGRRLLKSANL